MKPGLHVVAASATRRLAEHGVVVPEAGVGLLDVLRMLEGLRPEPPEGQPLFVFGLDELAGATGDPGPLLRATRSGLVEGRAYFEWKRIPLVLVLRGEVVDRRDDTGLRLGGDSRSIDLAPLLGTKLEPAKAGVDGWWWAPQLG